MKILVANDGSVFGEAAVEAAANVVDPFMDTNIKVVTVVVPADTTDVEQFIATAHHLDNHANTLVEKAERIACSSADTLKEKFLETDVIVTHEVLAGSAARAIVEEAENWHADLIVLGSHGHGFWKRTFVGTVSDQVLHHAPCSVLIIRQKEVAESVTA